MTLKYSLFLGPNCSSFGGQPHIKKVHPSAVYHPLHCVILVISPRRVLTGCITLRRGKVREEIFCLLTRTVQTTETSCFGVGHAKQDILQKKNPVNENKSLHHITNVFCYKLVAAITKPRPMGWSRRGFVIYHCFL